MIRRAVCAMVLLLAQTVASSSAAGPLSAADRAAASREATDRGSIVYQHYCATCHGIDADGNGRAARLYASRPADLQASRVNDAYRELIIRRGGAQLGRSEFMPSWEQELTDVQVHDVVAYLRSLVK